MIIDNQLLDQVSGQAKESERLRMNFNLPSNPQLSSSASFLRLNVLSSLN